ncbi:MAG: 50S ribosomal protein L35 [Caldisericaceae bacterium]|jgi:large subunit ribosomal protein L35|nr:50S ribosomal protein L35 [Caldisericaceae bacterium]
MKRKMKTTKSAAKRFKITGSGKIVAYGAGHSHHLEKKGMKRKKRQLKKRVVEREDLKNIKALLPYLK